MESTSGCRRVQKNIAAELYGKHKAKGKGVMLGAMAYINAMNGFALVALDAAMHQDGLVLPKPRTLTDELATGEKAKAYQVSDNMGRIARAAANNVTDSVTIYVAAMNGGTLSNRGGSGIPSIGLMSGGSV